MKRQAPKSLAQKNAAIRFADLTDCLTQMRFAPRSPRFFSEKLVVSEKNEDSKKAEGFRSDVVSQIARCPDGQLAAKTFTDNIDTFSLDRKLSYV